MSPLNAARTYEHCLTSLLLLLAKCKKDKMISNLFLDISFHQEYMLAKMLPHNPQFKAFLSVPYTTSSMTGRLSSQKQRHVTHEIRAVVLYMYTVYVGLICNEVPKILSQKVYRFSICQISIASGLIKLLDSPRKNALVSQVNPAITFITIPVLLQPRPR